MKRPKFYADTLMTSPTGPTGMLNVIDGKLHFEGDADELARLFFDKVLAPLFQKEMAQYNELIMAVERKFPGETRHQTALRYIRQAEAEVGSTDSSTESGCGGQPA